MILVSLRKLILVSLSLVALVGALSIVAMPQAQAATHCFASSCNHVDPYAGGCAADARSLRDITFQDMEIQLRYSPTCNAAWVKEIVGQDGICNHGPQAYVVNSAGVRENVPAGSFYCSQGTESAYSRMVSDTTNQTAHACGWFVYPYPSYGDVSSACTTSV